MQGLGRVQRMDHALNMCRMTVAADIKQAIRCVAPFRNSLTT